jgi:hypothetical protein
MNVWTLCIIVSIVLDEFNLKGADSDGQNCFVDSECARSILWARLLRFVSSSFNSSLKDTNARNNEILCSSPTILEEPLQHLAYWIRSSAGKTISKPTTHSR